MTSELAKTFDPASIEAKWYQHWEESGAFRPERPDAEPFTIVNPPPNVTGSLHIGHALDNTLQDIVIRYERLRGKDALWVVGTDHAGIATQMVVERQLEASQDKRTNYTREQFVDKVWEWKAESGGTITRQLRRLGCSMDWSREQFTMDPHFTRAVIKVFVDLHNQGLIYRDKRLVNWDPKLKTAISDLEVETREIQGHFWHFKYPLADGVTLANGQDYIEVATTRPETMLADMAVAVHPTDERYQSVIGKHVVLPITGRRVPIVADEHADPELGSGAVKITPGHDFNDFEVGRRAGIKAADMLNMLDAEAKVVQTADGLVPEGYLGKDRFDARAMVVAELKQLGCLIPHVTRDKEGNEAEHDAEPRTIQTPFGDRGGVVIEPWLTDQWYVDAEKLAKAPIDAVKDGRIEIVPKSWEKTFFNWMENIQPWCVSRQLWWGHRIPAWYGPTVEGESLRYDLPKPFVATDSTDAQNMAEDYKPYGGPQVKVVASQVDAINSSMEVGSAGTIFIWQDPDVLDTWFSSALWPFATLGWPDQTDLVKKHYPNSLLVSGFDILFFWDARMMMQGMHFMGEVPWPKLYLHGLVRAADGQKMSKSKGNVVDPLGLIDQYGADALRFFMAAMESQGRDVKMDESRVEGYRNFATKLWNATRFCQSNGITGGVGDETGPGIDAQNAINKWIIGEVVETLAQLNKAMADLRFDAAANTIYQFTWNTFCDWYIELVKPWVQAERELLESVSADGQKITTGLDVTTETKIVAGWVLDQILVMLHPFMPFITEELWSQTASRDRDLIISNWPDPAVTVDVNAKADVEWLIRLVSSVRGMKAELNIPPSSRLHARVIGASKNTLERLGRNMLVIGRLARIDGVVSHDEAAPTSAQIVVDEATFSIPLEGVIDIDAEKARLTKAMAGSEKERDTLAKRLGNPAFVEKAKPEAVEKARADHAHHAAEAERLKAALARLG